MMFTKLPVVVYPERATNAENRRKHQRGIHDAEKGTFQIVCDLVHLRNSILSGCGKLSTEHYSDYPEERSVHLKTPLCA